jgi:hypothetical protein
MNSTGDHILYVKPAPFLESPYCLKNKKDGGSLD